jgi:hypothetical protein
MGIQSSHWIDDEAPEGGQTFGPGFAIAWQRGPMVDKDGARLQQNGAFVEDVIKAAIDRILHYQSTKFASAYNSSAVAHLYFALDSLNQRTAGREARGVEGTHEV